MPIRAKELIAQLKSVTGARPRPPTKTELDRVRYTPITAGFAPVAELSRQIANRKGLAAEVSADGESKGVLLDVAELWEMYVLSIVRKAAAPVTVVHGTRDQHATRKLLHSDITGQGLGTLIPDVVLRIGSQIRGVVDAKYKSLHPSIAAPAGPQREDLYQMAAYLGRFSAVAGKTSWGLLAYPFDQRQPSASQAEQLSPWSLDGGRKIVFASLPHSAKEAIAKTRTLIAPMVSDSAKLAHGGLKDG